MQRSRYGLRCKRDTPGIHSYQEDGSGTSPLEEIDEVAPGQSKDLTIDLDEAKYLLICNMVHVAADGTQDAHYARGMRTAFRVD